MSENIEVEILADGDIETSVVEGGGTFNYNELRNKPSINGVELSGNKTTSDLGIAVSSESIIDALGYTPADEDDLKEKADKTQIPLKTSQLTNDSGYITEHQSLAEYAKKTEIPSKVSELENDEGYLKEHQSLSAYALKSEIPSVPTSEISANTSARHTHSNKSILDGITQAKISQWDSGGGISEAPTDGKLYGRKYGAWSEVTEDDKKCNKPYDSVSDIVYNDWANGAINTPIVGNTISFGTQAYYGHCWIEVEKYDIVTFDFRVSNATQVQCVGTDDNGVIVYTYAPYGESGVHTQDYEIPSGVSRLYICSQDSNQMPTALSYVSVKRMTNDLDSHINGLIDSKLIPLDTLLTEALEVIGE